VFRPFSLFSKFIVPPEVVATVDAIVFDVGRGGGIQLFSAHGTSKTGHVPSSADCSEIIAVSYSAAATSACNNGDRSSTAIVRSAWRSLLRYLIITHICHLFKKKQTKRTIGEILVNCTNEWNVVIIKICPTIKVHLFITYTSHIRRFKN